MSDDKPLPQWLIDLAWQVDEVAKPPAALARFREMLNQWNEQQLAQIENVLAWQQKQGEYFVKMAKLSKRNRLRNRIAQPPEPGWQWDSSHVHRAGSDGGTVHEWVFAWVPAELATVNEPKVTSIFPLGDRALALDEKYVALAIVHDLACKGVASLVPWDEPAGEDGSQDENDSFDQCKARLPFGAETVSLRDAQDKCPGALQRFLADVREDLATSKAESASTGCTGDGLAYLPCNPLKDNAAWSKPMSKAHMMQALRMDSLKKFNAFSKQQGIREAGNRQTWRLRIDGLSADEVARLRDR